MRSARLIFLGFLLLCVAFAKSGSAELIHQSHFYPKTALPNTNVNFTFRLFNPDPLALQFYVAIIITAQATRSFELYEPPGTIHRIGINERKSFTFNVRVPADEGIYSVSVVLFDRFTDARITSFFGTFPLTIGTPTQAISAHPSQVDFGKLHQGRFMYPIPIKVRYKIFIPNRLGDVQPWALRIYTDNANKYKGLTGTVRQLSFGGLVHSSGKYTIPLKFWNLNWGPETHNSGWDASVQGPPPVEKDIFWKGVLLDESTPDHPIHDHDRKPWLRIPDYSEMTVDTHSWRRMVGQFPYDGQFINPTNPTGDYTLSVSPDPFDFYFAIEVGPTTVHGRYSGRVVLELFSP